MNRKIFLLMVIFIVGVAQAGSVSAAGGSVGGKISYEGTPPEPEHFTITKNPDFCGAEMDFFHVTVKNGVVQGVAVLIEGMDGGKSKEPTEHKMVGRGCAFLPFSGVVEKLGKGRKKAPGLAMVNEDPVSHNPHPFEVRGMARRTLWNVGLPEKGSVVTKKLRVKKGNVVKIQCDQHDFMHAWVRVATNAYWTRAEKDGSFKINDVPPGTYQLVAWHPILGEQKKEITVNGGGTAEASFAFSGAGSGR